MIHSTTQKDTVPSGKHTLLQSGGEGAVYLQNGKAIKIYHHPNVQRSEKMQAFVARRLLRQLPPGVLGPQRLFLNRQGIVEGFEMKLLPQNAQPWKKLSQPAFCQHLGLDLAQELDLLIALQQDLRAIHTADVVVGDLNDHNIFFDLTGLGTNYTGQGARNYWIDVDSFQFGPFPCPVALGSFLDPLLYDAGDFSGRPLFSRASDWYAFTVLMCKVLLKTHPYGGSHHHLKTLNTRATARISVLHPAVTYPKGACPPRVLDDQTLDFLKRVFEQEHREPVPETLLRSLRHNLTRCPHCGQKYASSRPRCPACDRRAPAIRPAKVSTSLAMHTLYQTSGFISHVFVKPSGRMVAIVRQNTQYKLLHLGASGLLKEMPLFSGAAGARFALFQDILVVSTPSREKLLLLEIGADHVRSLSPLQSERFDGETVFAATPQALYRIANGYVLRGSLHRGSILEELVTSAHRWRTQLWASPSTDHVAGFHRLFADHCFFVLDDHGNQHIVAPTTAAASTPRSIVGIDVAWGPQNVAFLWHERGNGNLQNHLQIADFKGRTLHHAIMTGSRPPYDRLDGKLVNDLTVLHPSNDGLLKINPDSQTLLPDLADVLSANATLYWHPRGVVVRDSGSLFLVEAL